MRADRLDPEPNTLHNNWPLAVTTKTEPPTPKRKYGPTNMFRPNQNIDPKSY